MAGKEQEPVEQPAPTQKTPKGYEIPLPTRKSVFDAFKKIAKPKKG
jgi:hypothetical protein